MSLQHTEAEEVEGFRLPLSERLPLRGRVAAKADQPGLVRVQRQIERAHSLLQFLQECSRLVFMLEADDRVVRIADYDHVPGGFGPAPAMDPQIVHVVQVGVR